MSQEGGDDLMVRRILLWSVLFPFSSLSPSVLERIVHPKRVNEKSQKVIL